VGCEPTSTVSNVHAGDDLGAPGDVDAPVSRRLTLKLDSFAWQALEAEASQLQVSVHELASFALLYYLADRDSGRIARRFPQSTTPLGEPHPLGKLLPD
jgi:hypothetical protein